MSPPCRLWSYSRLWLKLRLPSTRLPRAPPPPGVRFLSAFAAREEVVTSLVLFFPFSSTKTVYIYTSTSTSASTRTRGITMGKKTHEEVRTHGQINLEWFDLLKSPSSQVVQGRLARNIGSVVRDKVPMVASSYWLLQHLQIVYNHISTNYDVSHDNVKMFEYIQKIASGWFNQWMLNCKAHFETYGLDVPVEFVERVDDWTWLMAHWSTEESKARSVRMKAVRASEKKVGCGPQIGFDPLRLPSEKRKEYGDKAPIPNSWVEVYEKNAPDAAAAMTAAVEASIASFEASNPTPPPVKGGSDSTPPAPIPLPVKTQIGIVQGEVGVLRGTVIRGLG